MNDSDAVLENLLWVYFSGEWFNATQLALSFNKCVDDYISRPETLGYIAAACKYENITDLDSLIVNKGGVVWMSPLLIADYGWWLDMRFGIWQGRILTAAFKKGGIGEYTDGLR